MHRFATIIKAGKQRRGYEKKQEAAKSNTCRLEQTPRKCSVRANPVNTGITPLLGGNIYNGR
jgi:hypothetical protein